MRVCVCIQWDVPSFKTSIRRRLKSKISVVPIPPTSSLLDEILFHVVTVNLGATEDYGLVHLVLSDGPHCVLALQHLNGFGPHF